MMPTADHVARAILAACRETGEDPIAVASGQAGTFRARHYAMWALVHVFPDIPRGTAAQLVGAPGKPIWFYNNSKNNALPGNRPGGGRWWSGIAYARVIAAVEAVGRPLAPPREPPASETRPKPLMRPVAPFRAGGWTLEPGGYRPPAGTIAAILDDDAGADRPVFDKGRIGADRKPQTVAATGKKSLYDDLRRAVENTAKMTPPREE